MIGESLDITRREHTEHVVVGTESVVLDNKWVVGGTMRGVASAKKVCHSAESIDSLSAPFLQLQGGAEGPKTLDSLCMGLISVSFPRSMRHNVNARARASKVPQLVRLPLFHVLRQVAHCPSHLYIDREGAGTAG